MYGRDLQLSYTVRNVCLILTFLIYEKQADYSICADMANRKTLGSLTSQSD